MGKWAEVHCNCPNRVPLPNSDPYFDRPHRKKRRLTKKESEEVAEWERTLKDMFDCGHRGGVIFECWPGDIIHLGYLIGSIFRDEPGTLEIFSRIGDWRCYEDELLLIHPPEAALWLLEIEELLRALQGFGNLPPDKTAMLIAAFFRDEMNSRINLERRFDEVSAEMPFARVVPLRHNVQQSKRPDIESTVEQMIEALKNAVRLVQASGETANPIRLLW